AGAGAMAVETSSQIRGAAMAVFLTVALGEVAAASRAPRAALAAEVVAAAPSRREDRVASALGVAEADPALAVATGAWVDRVANTPVAVAQRNSPSRGAA